jgi:hypothetical protein
MDDEQETPEVRFNTILTTAAVGDEEGVRQILSAYKKDQTTYGRTIGPAAGQSRPATLPWDTDKDGLADDKEFAMSLDRSNPDTDGDGIPDGSDRNPLAAPKPRLSEDQETARFLVYLYARYLNLHSPLPRGQDERSHPGLYGGPPPHILIIEATDKYFDGNDSPSLLAGVEITGIDNLVLFFDPARQRHFETSSGKNTGIQLGVRYFETNLDKITEEKVRFVHRFVLKNLNPLPGEKVFELSHWAWRSYLIRVKRFGTAWLPVEWRLHWTS